MGFEIFKSEYHGGAAMVDQVAIRASGSKNGKGVAMVIAGNLIDAVGWNVGDRLCLMIGTGDDAGWLCVRPDGLLKLYAEGHARRINAAIGQVGFAVPPKTVRCPAEVKDGGILIDARALLATPIQQAAE